ncbi:MAG: SDR family oxidoreductase [Proteobacteria bacterium]|nr:SDR family oxidoreductase [Pseudomonadota bacterium]MDA1059982.1 SDR family oxidoreductase [Pseudomonadota bacterium]
MGRVADKVALITGASNPVAQASAQALADEGACIIVVDADLGAAERAAQATKAASERLMWGVKENASEAAWESLIAKIEDRFGQLNVLVNGPPVVQRRSISDLSLADLRALQESNIVEPWLGLKHGVAAMRRCGGGSIINLSLGLARVGASGFSANCANAAGVRVMSQAAALECGQNADGVRVNSVLVDHENLPNRAEVAAAVVYLASDESRFMTAGEIAFGPGVVAA